MLSLICEPFWCVLNRELDPFRFGIRLGNSDVVAIQLPEQVVEGGSEVLHNITQDDADLKPSVLLNRCDTKDMIARLIV